MRRIVVLLVVVLLLWCGAWFAGKSILERESRAFLAQPMSQDFAAAAEKITVSGFPTQFTLRAEEPWLHSPASGLGWQAERLDISTPLWSPWRLVARPAPQQVLMLAGQGVDLTSERMEARLNLSPGPNLLLSEARLTADRLALASDMGWEMESGPLSLSLIAQGGAGNSYELTLDPVMIQPDPRLIQALSNHGLPSPAASGAALPDRAAIEGKALLRLSAPLDRHVAETAPALVGLTMENIAFSWGTLALAAKGDLREDAAGFAEGEVTLTVAGWRQLPGLLVAMDVVQPQFEATLTHFFQLLAREENGIEVLHLPVRMTGGQLLFGQFMIGPAPRLRPQP